jgi:hypothetical protein
MLELIITDILAELKDVNSCDNTIYSINGC